MNPVVIAIGGVVLLWILSRNQAQSATNPNVGTAGVLSQVNNLLRTALRQSQPVAPQQQQQQGKPSGGMSAGSGLGGGSTSGGAGKGGSSNQSTAIGPQVPFAGQINVGPGASIESMSMLAASGWTADDVKAAQAATGYDVNTIAQLSELGVTQEQMTMPGQSVYSDLSEATGPISPEQQAAVDAAWSQVPLSSDIAAGAVSDNTQPTYDPSTDVVSTDYNPESL